jgi:hypothetical protein
MDMALDLLNEVRVAGSIDHIDSDIVDLKRHDSAPWIVSSRAS